MKEVKMAGTIGGGNMPGGTTIQEGQKMAGEENPREAAVRRIKRMLKGEYRRREKTKIELEELGKWKEKLLEWPVNTVAEQRLKLEKLDILEEIIAQCNLSLHLEDLDEILWDKG